jgi:DNA gyrase/topoisomerase IV subunit B
MHKATLNIQQVNNVPNPNLAPRLVPLNLAQQTQIVVQKNVRLDVNRPNVPPQPNIQLQVNPQPVNKKAKAKIEKNQQIQTAPVLLGNNQQGPNKVDAQLNVTSPQIHPSPGGTYRITAADYQRYGSTREHIYNITDTYIGSDEQMPRSERVLNLETMVFQEEEITIPEGVERIFVEISSNAGDNVARSLRHKIDPGEVTIKMDREIISVRNGGIPIPIEIHPIEKMWAPQLIFGVLHSSSNYNKDKVRTECGRNGYGAKLTNIFSKYFMVTVGDPNNKRWYRQIWTENMTVQGEPEIKEGYTGEAFVEVVYKMDFKRFGYENYPDQAFRLFSRHAADMSFTGKVPVSFNGIKLNVQKSKDYAKLYLGEEGIKNSIVYYQWAPGVKTVEKKGIEYAVEPGIVPMVEICAVDTPDNALNVSFVNGMWTRNGGVHADAAFKAVATGLLNTVNGGEKSKKKNRAHKLNLGDVKRHVSMFISCWLGDPKFDGQTKTALRSPTPKIVIDDKILQPITKWDLINRLYAELEAKHFRASVKSDGKKKRFLSDIKGEDANDAGTIRSGNCTLYVTEGKSAMGFAVSMLSLFEKGRDFIGLLPLKGKPLNVMNAPPMQVAENTEILEIKKMLGLRERVNYLLDENFQTLRYGHLMILADADTDGKHILGLVLNLFHCKYPSLLARGYVKYLRTKIVDVKKGRQYVKFYSSHEYEQWQAATPDWKTWEHNYYKGLGSSSDADIAEEFRAPKIVQCFYDDYAPMALELAFHEKLADNRKDWIKNWMPDFKVEEMQMQPISAFINHELIQFSIADIARSIPRFMDGLKKVQRKIIWGSMKKWKKTKKNEVVKVGNLASYVSEKTEYHHGPKSMCDAIVNMVHDFVGSNNLPYFRADGQFGCVDPETPVILWNGRYKLAKNIVVGDELIGDDGNKRTVNHIVSGIDDMYEIKQAHGDSYTVNSIHILTLIVTLHKNIAWKESTNSWVLTYYDRDSKKVKTKSVCTYDGDRTNSHYNKTKYTKEEGYKVIKDFSSTIDDDNIVDIRLNDYLSLSQNQKNYFYGFKSLTSVKWEKRDVPFDPYIFGAWLGDGDLCGRGFTTIDMEIVKKYVTWANTIGAEIVHHKDPDSATYHYGIRRRGSGKLYAIGDPRHNSFNCVGCQTSKNKCEVCDWVFENFDNSEVKIHGVASNGMLRDDLNPFREILKANGLYRNKHIPDIYIKNDENVRLSVLAGLIDTDGTLRKHSSETGYHFEIFQKGDIHGEILTAAKTIAMSLGFKTSLYRGENGMWTLMISGCDIYRIPTLIHRKKINENILAKNPNVTSFRVQYLGKGPYCGWYIDGNERFLLGDFTVTHNTRNMMGKDAADPRYSKTRPQWWWNYIFKKEDVPLLTLLIDEGKECEPVTFLPIIPLHLINGTSGIGTGHSTFIPNHDPLDICQWLTAKIKGYALPDVLPWYRGFKGNIKLVERGNKKKKDGAPDPTEEPDSPTTDETTKKDAPVLNVLGAGINPGATDDEDIRDDDDIDDMLGEDGVAIDKSTRYTMLTTGAFNVSGNKRKVVTVTELPIGRATHDYDVWLRKQREDKVIASYTTYSNKDKVHFEITGMKNPSLKNLRLTRSYGMSNMVLLDTNDRPIKYNSTSEILESFYALRLPYYQLRKNNILKEMQEKVDILNAKIRFIIAVIHGYNLVRSNPQITIDEVVKQGGILSMGLSKKQILPQMQELGFSDDLLKRVTLYQCTLEELESARSELQKELDKKGEMEKVRPEDMWQADIDEFVVAYCKEYKCKHVVKNNVTLNINNPM